MPFARQYSDMLREYIELGLCEAVLVYKHLNTVHNAKWEKVIVSRAAHMRFHNLCGHLGHPDIRDHPLDWDKI
jgi:hypothetical protein